MLLGVFLFFPNPFTRIASAIFILLILSPLFLCSSPLCFVAVLCCFPLLFFSQKQVSRYHSLTFCSFFVKKHVLRAYTTFLLTWFSCAAAEQFSGQGFCAPVFCIVLIVVRFVTIMRALPCAVLHMEVSIQTPVYSPAICCCFKDN